MDPLLNNGEPGKVSPSFVRQLLSGAAPSTAVAPAATNLPPLLCIHLVIVIFFDRRRPAMRVAPEMAIPKSKWFRLIDFISIKARWRGSFLQLMDVDGMLMLDAIDDDANTTYAYTSPFLFAIQNRRQDTIISFRPAKPAAYMHNAVISSLFLTRPTPLLRVHLTRRAPALKV